MFTGDVKQENKTNDMVLIQIVASVGKTGSKGIVTHNQKSLDIDFIFITKMNSCAFDLLLYNPFNS